MQGKILAFRGRLLTSRKTLASSNVYGSIRDSKTRVVSNAVVDVFVCIRKGLRSRWRETTKSGSKAEAP